MFLDGVGPGRLAERLSRCGSGESRVARESVRGLLRPDGLAPWRRPVLAPVRPAPGRAAPRRAPEGRARAAHGPATNGLTACRMRFADRLRGCATTAASPLRRHARADAYRGPLGLAPLSLPRGIDGGHRYDQTPRLAHRLDGRGRVEGRIADLGQCLPAARQKGGLDLGRPSQGAQNP